MVQDSFKRHERLVNRQGTPMSRQTIWSPVKEMQDEAPFERDFRQHHLRHTFGTTIAFNTKEPFYINLVMGHADISGQTLVEYTGRQVNKRECGSLSWPATRSSRRSTSGPRRGPRIGS